MPDDVFSVLDVLLALGRPYRVRAVEAAVGVRLHPSERSHAFFRIASGSASSGVIERVEVRESLHGRGGIVLVRLRAAGVTPLDAALRVGLTGATPRVPPPEAPPDALRVVQYPLSWGHVRLGADPESGRLRSIVLDAT